MFVRKDTNMDDICNVKEATISAETGVTIGNEIPESESFSISENTSNNYIIYGLSATFIDHNSYFDCYDSHTDTPLLERMKRAYRYCEQLEQIASAASEMEVNRSCECQMAKVPLTFIDTLCLVRKSCEINGLKQQEIQAQLRNETMHSLVQSNFQLIQSLDGSYRALHNFPHDDTIMTSYSTYLNTETLDDFFCGCPPEFKSGDIFDEFRKNIKSAIERTKSQFREVNPTIAEFLAIFGMALWSGYTANMSAETSAIVRRNRSVILKELQTVYSRNGSNGDASRLKDVFGLLSKSVQAIQS